MLHMEWRYVTQILFTSQSKFLPWMLGVLRGLSKTVSVAESCLTQYPVHPGMVHTQGLTTEIESPGDCEPTCVDSDRPFRSRIPIDLWPLQLSFSLWLILFLSFLFDRDWSKVSFLINIQNTKLFNTKLHPNYSITFPHSVIQLCLLQQIPSPRIKGRKNFYL